jgi:uncharacterized membrane protein YtjA (UPF0391 family)
MQELWLVYVSFNIKIMLRWSVIFFVIAIIAAIFGFGGIAEGAADIAKILFFIFLALFVIAILFGASIFKR